jgi:hypothetical protein
MTNFVLMTEFEMKDRKSSPDCSENPFFEKKDCNEKLEKLLKKRKRWKFAGLRYEILPSSE